MLLICVYPRESAANIFFLTLIYRQPTTRRIIADRQRKHNRQPEKAGRDHQHNQARTVAHVHEIKNDQRRLYYRDGQRDHGIQRSGKVEVRDPCEIGIGSLTV